MCFDRYIYGKPMTETFFLKHMTFLNISVSLLYVDALIDIKSYDSMF